jgi:hypothetical protein
MPTAPTLLAGLIDLADPGRPPHPGGHPCGALCVPACTGTDGSEPDRVSPTTTQEGRS